MAVSSATSTCTCICCPSALSFVYMTRHSFVLLHVILDCDLAHLHPMSYDNLVRCRWQLRRSLFVPRLGPLRRLASSSTLLSDSACGILVGVLVPRLSPRSRLSPSPSRISSASSRGIPVCNVRPRRLMEPSTASSSGGICNLVRIVPHFVL